MLTRLARQEELDLSPPRKVVVLGVGGIGSWVAWNLAQSGVPELVLIDHDAIEEHNRNRTLFPAWAIGLNKAIIMEGLIRDSFPDVKVEAIPERITNPKDIPSGDVLVDARDIFDPPSREEVGMRVVKLGYDGHRAVIHFNPGRKSVFGEGEGYRVVPSWLVPPQVLAAIITTVLVATPDSWPGGEEVISFDVRDLPRILMEAGYAEGKEG